MDHLTSICYLKVDEMNVVFQVLDLRDVLGGIDRIVGR